MFPLLAALALGQPDAAFARGVEASGDARAARPHFVDAARGYDAEWEAGDRSPALATNRSRAHALAGDLPGAVLAARSGLRETPSDRVLLRHLEALRDAVPYPPGTRPPRPTGVRTWLSPWDAFAVAAAGVLFAAAGAGWWLTARTGWAIPVGVLGVMLLLPGLAGAWHLHREAAAEPRVLVLVRPTPLRKGNGESYERRLDADLPRGAEVGERVRRGGWVQVELPGGVIGWVPESSTAGE